MIVKGAARAAATAAVALAVAGGLTGCHTDPGAAAIVGDYSISAATLQHEVNSALADPTAASQLGSDRAKFARSELSQLIQNRLLSALAAAHHVTVTTSELDQQVAQFAQQAGGMQQLEQSAAQSGVPKNEVRTFIRFYVLQQKVGDALVAGLPVTQAQLQAAYQQQIDSFDQVHAAHILVKSKALADHILAIVRKDPSQFAALAAKYSIDTSNKNNGGDLGLQPKSKFVPAFGNAVFAAKVGSYFEVHSQFGYHVVHVISHKVVSLAQAAPQLRSTVLSNARDAQMQQALTAEATKLGVHVNPRYGRWDAKNHEVVALPDNQTVSSPAPSSGG